MFRDIVSKAKTPLALNLEKFGAAFAYPQGEPVANSDFGLSKHQVMDASGVTAFFVVITKIVDLTGHRMPKGSAF
jgi:hypothetical protein